MFLFLFYALNFGADTRYLDCELAPFGRDVIDRSQDDVAICAFECLVERGCFGGLDSARFQTVRIVHDVLVIFPFDRTAEQTEFAADLSPELSFGFEDGLQPAVRNLAVRERINGRSLFHHRFVTRSDHCDKRKACNE